MQNQCLCKFRYINNMKIINKHKEVKWHFDSGGADSARVLQKVKFEMSMITKNNIQNMKSSIPLSVIQLNVASHLMLINVI